MRNEIIAAGLAVVVSAGCSGQPEIKSEEPNPNRLRVEGLARSPLDDPSPKTTIPQEVSPENKFQELTARLHEFEASVEPVPAEKLAKLIELIKAEGVLLDSSESRVYRIVRSINGTTYTAEADFGLNPPEDISGIDPAFLQIYIRRPGEDYAKQVVIDGNSYYNVGLPNSGQLVNGVVDAPLGYGGNKTYEDFMELYEEYGNLAWLAQDVADLTKAGAQAQADYRQAVEDILGKN